MKRSIFAVSALLMGSAFAQTNVNEMTTASNVLENLELEVEIANQITRDKKNEVNGTEHEMVPELSYKVNDDYTAIVNTTIALSNPDEGDSNTDLTNVEVGMERKLPAFIKDSKLKAGLFLSYETLTEAREDNQFDGAVTLEVEYKQTLTNNMKLKVKPAVVNYIRTAGAEGIATNAVKLEVNPQFSVMKNVGLELPVKLSKKYYTGDKDSKFKMNFIPTAVFSVAKNLDVELFNSMNISKSGDDQFFADDIMKRSLYGANVIFSL